MLYKGFMREILENWLQRGLRTFGVELRRVERRFPSDGLIRPTLAGALRHARGLGLRPVTIFDCGAARGDFTLQAARLFPEARHVMIEPLAEFAPLLESMRDQTPQSRLFVPAAVSDSVGQTTFNVHADLYGSSLFSEAESADTGVDGQPRTVPTTTLDHLAQEHGLKPPYLIKADVQGAEMRIIEGASTVLQQTDYVLLEVSFFSFFRGGPQFAQIVTAMAQRGFVPYEVIQTHYRPLDGAMSQADIAFVPDASPLRRDHSFASPKQRAQRTRALQREAPRP